MKYFTGNLLLLILSWLAVANSAEFHVRMDAGLSSESLLGLQL